ncbi:MAG: hypothetical protein E5X48_19085 [Mesorhizobium sp.]|nr:MAG: hypothetical protein E5X48_19085 [Mesorhizobium sp.]
MALTPELPSQPLGQTETDRLRRAWIDGLGSGPFAPFNIDEIKRKARARLDSNPGPEQCR